MGRNIKEICLKKKMVFTKEDVIEECKKTAPEFGFEPKLVYAFCLQESGRDKNGNFDAGAFRFEPGFLKTYIRPLGIETTNEILLSTSFGVLQMMGQSLSEVGFLRWYYEQQSDPVKAFLGNPLSEISIPKAINYYCANINEQVYWGVKFLNKKNKIAKGNLKLLCKYWNGSDKYYDEWIKKYQSIKEEI